jgi:hypothetical protein
MRDAVKSAVILRDDDNTQKRVSLNTLFERTPMPSKPRPRNLQPVISPRELATILYSLRRYQQMRTLVDADHFEEFTPLSIEEVDSLCQRLNFAPYAPKITAKNVPLTPSDIITIEQLSSFVSEDVGEHMDRTTRKSLNRHRLPVQTESRI